MTLHSPLYTEDLLACIDDLPLEKDLTVLVTGATGMVGGFLTDALTLAGCRVIAVARNETRLRERFKDNDRVTVFARDISLGAEGLPRADYILHAGANAHPMAFSTDPVGTMRANLLGTMSLLEHLRACGGKRLLFVSTGEIYGSAPCGEEGFSETEPGRVDPSAVRSCYPESKRAAETLCVSYAKQYDISTVIARLCYVYGPTVLPDNTRADAQFLRKALAKEDIVLKSTGSQVRSYCYVADAARALLTVLLRGENAQTYNIADRNGTLSIREYAETLARAAGTGVTFDLPPETERQGYSTYTRAVQNPAKLESLGWRARRAPEEGLSRTLRILRESGADIGQ